MKRIRIKRSFGYAPESLLNDIEISLAAKGLFCLISSKPDLWYFTLMDLSSLTKDTYDDIRAAMRELERYGYIRYEKFQDGKGMYHLIEDPVNFWEQSKGINR